MRESFCISTVPVTIFRLKYASEEEIENLLFRLYCTDSLEIAALGTFLSFFSTHRSFLLSGKNFRVSKALLTSGIVVIQTGSRSDFGPVHGLK